MDTLADLNKLRKHKKKAEEKNDLKEVGIICNAIGELLSQYGHHEEALQEHEMEKNASQALQDKIGEAVACRKIGECHCKLGNFEKALKLQNQYLELAQECNDKVETQRALATLGHTYYTQADARGADTCRPLLDRAERKFLQALRACEQLRSSSSTLTQSEFMAMKGRLLLNLGLVYDLRGADKESTEYLQKALLIAKQWHLEEEEYLCHFNQAIQGLRQGQEVGATLSLQQALAIATRLHDKPRQKEAICQLAVANVCAGEVKTAKHFLKKAYKMIPTPEESTKVIKLFKAVCTVEELKKGMTAGEESDRELFRVHEKLGDAFTDIGAHCGSYARAIKHYQSMVESGERAGLSAEALIPAYVSLAQTHADNRQPDLAISNYHKELQLRGGDHEQISRTWLNIAELEERRGDGYKVLSKSYMQAFTHARKAGHHRLQVQVLRSLIATQAAFKERRHKEQTEAKLQEIMAQRKQTSGGDSSAGEEEEEDDSQPPDSDPLPASDDHEADLSISDITDSDKSDEENLHPALGQSVVSTRVRRHKVFKKNEKGETPLHVACIRGQLRRVQTLLEEGHPVNVRDNCGWTPLHEAANHDFPAVVQALLEAGAHVNDRGGSQCGGLTPLIDAASCGNTAVMTLLLRRGANPLAKDDKGTTAIQSLTNWYRDYGDDLSQDLREEYNSVRILLQDKMPSGARKATPGSSSNPASSGSQRRVGGDRLAPSPSQPYTQRSYPSSSASRASQHTALRPGPSTAVSSEEEEEEDNAALYHHNPGLAEPSPSSQSATDAYRSSMLAIGSSAQRAVVREAATKPPSASQHLRHTPKPALIDEREMVGDDWLIDDLQMSGRKRRDRPGMDSLLSSDSVRPAKGLKRARLTDRQSLLDSDSEGENNLSNDRHKHVADPHSNGERSNLRDDRHERSSVSPSQFVDSGTVELGISAPWSEEDEVLPIIHATKRVAAHDFTESQEDGPGERDRLGNGRTGGQEGGEGGGGAPGGPGTQLPNQQPLPPMASLSADAPPPPLVKVKIEGSVFLIPIPSAETKTVGWLSEEASRRYDKHFGRRPLLQTLSSSGGFILSADDVLSAVLLSNGEQLEASVLGWDVPALNERYAKACKSLGTVKYRNIHAMLGEAETSHHLSLSGLGLRCAVFLPVSRALRGHTMLQQLHLPDNQLGDGGLQDLTVALADLRGLTHLNLAGNAITAAGLKHFATLFQPGTGDAVGEPALPVLGAVDLSHNSLGNGIVGSLCSIVGGLPSLTSLSLSACRLSAALFQHNRPALAACLRESGLQQLDVSHNRLGTLGVELLLRSLDAQTLTSLDLGHTCVDSSPRHLALHLKDYLNRDCALQQLSLESCCLHREDMEFLCRLPREVPGLRKLNVSLNRAVNTDVLQRLVATAAQCPRSQLTRLEAQACSISAPISTANSTSVSTAIAAQCSNSQPTHLRGHQACSVSEPISTPISGPNSDPASAATSAPIPSPNTVPNSTRNSASISSSVSAPDSASKPVSAPISPVSPSSSFGSLLQSVREKLASPDYPLTHLAFTCARLGQGEVGALSDAWRRRWPQGVVRVKVCQQSVALTLKQSDTSPDS